MDVSLPYSVPQEFILMKPFVSRFVRLKPEKLNGQSYVCMKIEIIGCKQYGKGFTSILLSLNIVLGVLYVLFTSLFIIYQLFCTNIICK